MFNIRTGLKLSLKVDAKVQIIVGSDKSLFSFLFPQHISQNKGIKT